MICPQKVSCPQKVPPDPGGVGQQAQAGPKQAPSRPQAGSKQGPKQAPSRPQPDDVPPGHLAGAVGRRFGRTY